MFFTQDLHVAGCKEWQMAESAMLSVKRHLWYLAEDTVVFALFDPDLAEAEKKEMAEALLQVPHPAAPLALGKPIMPDHILTGAAAPGLASFIGVRSWKLWELLGLREAWLQLPVAYWAPCEDYIFGEKFVHGLKVVNDGAERCIKSISDYAAATRDSNYREDILVIGNSHREIYQTLRKAALADLNAM